MTVGRTATPVQSIANMSLASNDDGTAADLVVRCSPPQYSDQDDDIQEIPPPQNGDGQPSRSKKVYCPEQQQYMTEMEYMKSESAVSEHFCLYILICQQLQHLENITYE